MSPKKMLLQVKTWSSQGNFRKVYQTLNGLPPARRNPDLDWYLAVACLRLSATCSFPQDRRMSDQARQLLLSLPEERQTGWEWMLTYGSVLLNLQRGKEAILFLEDADRTHPDSREIQTVLEQAREWLEYHPEPENFRTRTACAWRALLAVEPQLLALMGPNMTDEANEQFRSLLEQALHPVSGAVLFGHKASGSIFHLILPFSHISDLFPLRRFSAQAPRSFLEHGDILLGTPPHSDFTLRHSHISVRSEDMYVRIDPSSRTIFRIFFSCPTLLPLIREEGENSPTVLELAENALIRVLGDTASVCLVAELTIVPLAPDDSFSPIADLPVLLERAGVPLFQDPDQILANASENYEQNSALIPVTGDRSDIILGNTACPDFLLQYVSGSTEIADRWIDTGILAGFLWFPREGLDREGQDRNAWAMLESLQQHLNQTAGPEAFQLLGWAMGTERVYLDLIVWDYQTILLEGLAFFQEHPVREAAFQCFSSRQPTVWLVGGDDDEEEEEEEDGDF